MWINDNGQYEIKTEDLINVDKLKEFIEKVYCLGIEHGYKRRVEYEQTNEFVKEFKEKLTIP